MAFSNQALPIMVSTTQGDQLSAPQDIDFIIWISKTATAGDDLVISDDGGMVVVEDSADAANYIMIYPIGRTINKLKLTTLDSGKVYVYKRNKSRR